MERLKQMNKHGANNIKGINYQCQAALSLFLQYLREPNFSYIHLEAPNYADFNLVFVDGSKIICESKNWGKDINYSELKTILGTILRKNSITDDDKILIVCSNLNKKMAEEVRCVRYYDLKKAFNQLPDMIKIKFSRKIIEILPKVDFWEVKEKHQENIVYSLFEELLNLNVWLPKDKIEIFADEILLKKIQYGSAKSSIYRKQEIFDEIEKIRQNAIRDSGLFDKDRIEKQKQLENIITSIKNNNSPVWAKNQISAITADRDLMFFTLDRFKKEKIDDLNLWDDLWQAAKIHIYSFGLFDIFEKNLHAKQNREYILKFISDNIGEERSYYSENLFEEQSLEIIKKIIGIDSNLLKDSLEILKSLLENNRDDYFYLKSKHRKDLLYHKDEICGLLKLIYDKSMLLRDEIYNTLISTFNLVEDDGEHSLFTPPRVFEILKEHLLSDMTDFEIKFLKMKDVLAKQYDLVYDKYGAKFKGWELMGGMSCYWEDNIKIDDRHFIRYLLRDALKKYNELHPDEAWNFIVDKCLVKEQDVSFDRPDFLNRTCIPFVLEKYFSDDAQISDVSFGWLKDFILSKKGIPHKSDLIYQELYNKYLNTTQTDKLWMLVKIGVDRYELPISPFLDKIVTELVKNRHKEAIEVVKKWLKNPKYQTSIFRADRNFTKNIRNLIEIDFGLAINLFTEFIKGEFFIKQYDDFDVYDIAGLLNTIIIKNPEKGIGILNEINKNEVLSKNQQILLTNSILNYKERDTDKPEILLKIYNDFINPLLDSLDNDINKIKGRFLSYARESIVKFAEALAEAKNIKDEVGKALRIIKVFINDPDPYLPGQNPEDPEDKYNEHLKVGEHGGIVQITSVRGWCAHVLMDCAVLKGRNYIEEIVNLTEKLTKDENYYIKQMSCFPLGQLAANRLTVLPNNSDILFLNDDRRKALELSKRVEEIAFSLLKDIVKISDDKVKMGLTQSILSVFNHIRALNQDSTMELLRLIRKLPDESIAEFIPLFVYYALFRKNSFKNWKFKEKRLYDDIENFDDSEFIKVLEDLIINGSPKVRESIANNFWSLPEKTQQGDFDEELFALSIKYLKMLAKKYDNEVCERIFYFIKDFINKKPKECIDLWKICVEKQRQFFIENKQLAGDFYWRLGYCHQDVLLKIREIEKDDKFLKWFEFLSGYPVLIASDLSKAIEVLLEFPKNNATVKKIFNNLVVVNSSFYEKQQEWENK